MAFPQTLDNFTNPTPSTPTNSPVTPLSGQLSQLNNAVEAIESVIGVTGSTVPTSIEYRLADVQAVAASAESAVTESAHLAMHDTLRLPTWPTWGTATPQVWKLSDDDTIEATSTNALLITTANVNYKSGIGRVERPLGAAGTNSDRSAGVDATKGLPWVDDSSYVNGAAGVTTLIGGYDHVCNQIAGTVIGGGHNYLQYSALGHSTIVGGSNNRVSGGRAAIIGGSNNTVTANQSFCFGGYGNTVNGPYSVIIGGIDHVVHTTATGYSAICGGRQHSITANYAACIGGYSNTITHDQAVLIGQDGLSDAVGALTISRTKLSVAGDVQTTIHEYGWRTTNATIANMTQNFVIPAAQKVAVAIHAQMVAIDEATGACAIFVWDGGMIWDGSATATFYDAGGSGVSRNFTQIVDNIGVAALPLWSGTSAVVRPKVTGKASTNIKWSCTAIFTVTRL